MVNVDWCEDDNYIIDIDVVLDDDGADAEHDYDCDYDNGDNTLSIFLCIIWTYTSYTTRIVYVVCLHLLYDGIWSVITNNIMIYLHLIHNIVNVPYDGEWCLYL